MAYSDGYSSIAYASGLYCTALRPVPAVNEKVSGTV